MISTCSQCGILYEFASEECANEPDRVCRRCYLARLLAEEGENSSDAASAAGGEYDRHDTIS